MSKRTSTLLKTGVLAILVAFLGSSTRAGILATTTNALSGFQGTRSFTDGPVLPPFLLDEVTANIDFAVFAPVDSGSDTFDQFLSEFGITFAHGVPSNHYTYAYQVEVDFAFSAAQLFTVGTEFSGVLGGSAPSFIPIADYGNGGVVNGDGDEDATATSYQGGTSALWEYKTSTGPSSFVGNLDSTEWSGIMYFSANNAPTWDAAQLTAGLASAGSASGEDYPSTGLGGTGVPTPAPEPGSLILLGIGLGSTLVMGGRRRSRI